MAHVIIEITDDPPDRNASGALTSKVGAFNGDLID